MAGIVDDKGVQWEHCNFCAAWVRLPNLGYLKPSKAHPHGADICVKCVDAGLRAKKFRFGYVVPAPEWKRVRVAA